MASRAGDSIFRHVKTNHMLKPDNEANINDYNFMPSLEIKLSEKTDELIEKFKELGLISSIEGEY